MFLIHIVTSQALRNPFQHQNIPPLLAATPQFWLSRHSQNTGDDVTSQTQLHRRIATHQSKVELAAIHTRKIHTPSDNHDILESTLVHASHSMKTHAVSLILW